MKSNLFVKITHFNNSVFDFPQKNNVQYFFTHNFQRNILMISFYSPIIFSPFINSFLKRRLNIVINFFFHFARIGKEEIHIKNV